eukprot:365567-Chlamydomonas_euryale.AAC.10
MALALAGLGRGLPQSCLNNWRRHVWELTEVVDPHLQPRQQRKAADREGHEVGRCELLAERVGCCGDRRGHRLKHAAAWGMGGGRLS